MATDYAQLYTPTYTLSGTVPSFPNPVTNVNDNDDTTMVYCTCSSQSACGAGAIITIDFTVQHNIHQVNFLMESYDTSGANPPLPSSFYLYYIDKDGTQVTLASFVDVFINKTLYTYTIDRRISGVRCAITTVANIGTQGSRCYTISAIGYDSSGNLQFENNGVIKQIADTLDITDKAVRYYNGVDIVGVNLMRGYDTPLLINNNNTIKSIAIVE